MMQALQLFFALVLLHFTYTVGQLFLAAYCGVHHANDHYYLGRAPHFIQFKIKKLAFSVGLYMPLPWLSKIYRIEDGQQLPLRYYWEFTEVTLAKRLLVTLGGILTWTLLATLTFIVISYTENYRLISAEETNKWGLYPTKAAKAAGFERGDRILLLNGAPLHDFMDLNKVDKSNEYLLLRGGKEVKILVSPIEDFKRETPLFLYLDAPFELNSIEPSFPAEKAGLQKGDRILQVNSIPVRKEFELREQLDAANDSVWLLIERSTNSLTDTISVKASLGAQHRLGVTCVESIAYSSHQRSLGEALAEGVRRVSQCLIGNFKGLCYVVSGTTPVAIAQGPVQISTMFHASGLQSWTITAIMALSFVFLNFLPLPGSVFWELLALAYEGLFRKRLSYEHYRRLARIGTFVLIVFFIWTFISDLSKF